MTMPARQLPVPDGAPPATWQSFKTRLDNWVLSVAQAFNGQKLRQVEVTQITPDPPTIPGAWYGTVPFTIDADADGTPRAELVGNGTVQFFKPGVLAAGQWNIQTVNVAGIATVAVVLGTPASPVWFAFLVAR